MVGFGSNWASQLQPTLHRNLTRRVRSNQKRLYLGAESQDDLIWQSTHGELGDLLIDPSIQDSIVALTQTEPEFLRGKLYEIKEIRNILAHNRALSERSFTILLGLIASLEESVRVFRQKALYHDNQIDIDTSQAFPFQGFVASTDEFMSYVRLPESPFNQWPDARRLLSTFSNEIDSIIAFCLNKSGSEYAILSPRSLPTNLQQAILDRFKSSKGLWTDTSFEQQPPAFVCSPKIWFYENSNPLI